MPHVQHDYMFPLIQSFCCVVRIPKRPFGRDHHFANLTYQNVRGVQKPLVLLINYDVLVTIAVVIAEASNSKWKTCARDLFALKISCGNVR